MKTMVEAAPVVGLNGATSQGALMFEDAPAVELPAAMRTKHTQPVNQAEALAAVGAMLTGLQMASDPLRTLLDGDGITATYIASCGAQRDAALAAREARQQAIAAEKQAVFDVNTLLDRSHCAVMALRQVARTVLTDSAAVTALGLNEEMPRSPALFVNEARRLLAVAQQPPYAAALVAAAYHTERLQEMLAEVAAVETAYGVRCDMECKARHATVARNIEFTKLNRAARQVKVQVKALLRRNPGTPLPAGF
ncbi:MAG: hypothetical protein IPM07_23895 [Anaerolineales bacterium]|nr:hypothetical protein [Anaerolineales bacterium]